MIVHDLEAEPAPEVVAAGWLLVNDGVLPTTVFGKATPLSAHTVRSTIQACC